jgi:hypothetical protein
MLIQAINLAIAWPPTQMIALALPTEIVSVTPSGWSLDFSAATGIGAAVGGGVL